MLVNRCSQLISVYRTFRSVTLFRCLLVRKQPLICARCVQFQSATKHLLDDAEKLKLDGDRKLFENTHSQRLWKLHVYSLLLLVLMSYSSVALYASLKPKKDKTKTESWAIDYMLRAHDFLTKWKLILCGSFAGFGLIQFVGMSIFISRNVHSIVLLKNGKDVLIKTYGHTPIMKQLVNNRMPLNELSCLTGRHEKVSFMQLETAGSKKRLYMDKDGRFYCPDLFDATVGVKRKLTLKK